MHKRSATTEKEHPKLDDQTRELIKAYRKSQTAQNHADLREKIGQNYDAVVAKRKAKLNELKRTAKGRSKNQRDARYRRRYDSCAREQDRRDDGKI